MKFINFLKLKHVQNDKDMNVIDEFLCIMNNENKWEEIEAQYHQNEITAQIRC
jgi:hypothetical protein